MRNINVENPCSMKLSLDLLIILLLSLQCLLISSCEKDIATCGDIVPVLPQIRESIPYDEVDTLQFTYGDDPARLTTSINKIDGMADGFGRCIDFVEVSLTTVNSLRNFFFLLSTGGAEDELNFDFRFGLAGSQRPQKFTLQYSELEISSNDLSVSVVSGIDTTFADSTYDNLLIITDEMATEDGKNSTILYSAEFGLVQVTRINSPLITLTR